MFYYQKVYDVIVVQQSLRNEIHQVNICIHVTLCISASVGYNRLTVEPSCSPSIFIQQNVMLNSCLLSRTKTMIQLNSVFPVFKYYTVLKKNTRTSSEDPHTTLEPIANCCHTRLCSIIAYL